MHHELICFLYACYSKSLLLFLLGSLLDVCGVGAAPLRPPLGDVQGTCSRFKRRAAWPFKAEGRLWQIKQAIIVLRWAHEEAAAGSWAINHSKSAWEARCERSSAS